jgi:hypothetical protein
MREWLMIGVGVLAAWLVWEPWVSFANQVVPPGRYPLFLLMAFAAVPPVLVGGLVAFLLYQIVARFSRDRN